MKKIKIQLLISLILTLTISHISGNTIFPVVKQNGNSINGEWSSKLAKKTDCFDCA